MNDISVIYRRKERFLGERLKILVFKPITRHFFGGPFILQDAIEALGEIGHEVGIVDLEGCGSTPKERLERLIHEIAVLQPDFVFTLNFVGFVPILMDVMEKMGIPFVSWFVDSPLQYLKKGCNSKYCVVFVCDRVYIKELVDLGFKNVYYLPGATNPEVFCKIENDIDRYSCNISFVGSSHAGGYIRYRELIKDGNAQRALSEAIRLQIQNPTLKISEILEEVEKLLPSTVIFKDKKDWIPILEEAAMALYRKEIIESLADYGVHLYGDGGWRILLDNNKVKIFDQLDYYTQLPRLYNASKINLNITLFSLKTAVNQRVFDVPACGGFLLTDYRRDLNELFRLGKEVVSYKDRDELVELVRYFLRHPDEREEIAKRGQARVLKEHTYGHRMRELVKTLKDLYG